MGEIGVAKMTLYLDICGTLVYWENASENSSSTRNNDLLDSIRRFRMANPDARIVVWSSGGSEYVQFWCDRLGLGDCEVEHLDKYEHMSDNPDWFQKGDVVIDDDPIPHRTHRPSEWRF